ASAPAVTNEFAPFNDSRQRASYALGMLLGHQWQQQGVDVDLDLVSRGMRDVQSDKETLITPAQMQAALDGYKKELMAKQQRIREQLAAENKKKGEDFLASNKKRPGIKTLADGLQYKVIVE